MQKQIAAIKVISIKELCQLHLFEMAYKKKIDVQYFFSINNLLPGSSINVKILTDGAIHCVKSVRICSYSGPYFPVFSGMRENADLNNAEYGHFLCSSRGMRLVLRHNSIFFMKFR